MIENEYVQIISKGKHLPTLVAFSQVNTPPGKFKPYKAIIEADVNIIFVNDHGNLWYQHGIVGYSIDPKEAAEMLIRAARELGNGHVTTFGTSMGAYGALLYGLLGGADKCLAFGVESVLNKQGSRSQLHMPDGLKVKYRRLKPLMNQNTMKIWLLASESDEWDLISQYWLRDIPNVHTYTVKGSFHPGVQPVHLENKLVHLIETFTKGNETEEDIPRRGILEENQEAVVALYHADHIKKVKKDKKYHIKYLKRMFSTCKGESLYWLRLGEAYHRLRQHDDAEEAWWKSIDLCEYQFEAYAKLGALYKRRGKRERAEKLLKHSILINPWHAHAYHSLGLMYMQAGDLDEAGHYLKCAVKINRGNPTFRESLITFFMKDSDLGYAEASFFANRIRNSFD